MVTMDIVAVFWCWQSIVVTLFIYAMTESVRRFVQALWAGWKKNKLYNEFGLWAMPVGIGALLGVLMRGFPWPPALSSAMSARVTYSSILGLFCGVVYGRIKVVLQTGKPPNV